MIILNQEIIIELYLDGNEDGYIKRDDKHRSIYYNRVTKSSVRRVKQLVLELSKTHKVMTTELPNFIHSFIYIREV